MFTLPLVLICLGSAIRSYLPRLPYKQRVVGSNLTWGTISSTHRRGPCSRLIRQIGLSGPGGQITDPLLFRPFQLSFQMLASQTLPA